jgi:hypothetical protein
VTSKTIWTEISYPAGDDKHLVRSSRMVEIAGIGEVDIEYHTLYRTGDAYGILSLPILCLTL